MIQKKVYAVCLSLVLLCCCSQTRAQQGKGEIGLAYGYYSMFTLIQGAPFSASTGTPNINFRYYISNIVTVGLSVGYENNQNWGSFLTFAPECTFRYIDTKDSWIRVRLYGAASYGLTVFNDPDNDIGHNNKTGPKLWGFQGTPFGIRMGRKISEFAEVGFGYKGLINLGVSYRFQAVHKTVLVVADK